MSLSANSSKKSAVKAKVYEGISLMLERRSEPRAQAVYRAAYVRSARGLNFVMMKNISDSGAAFQGQTDLEIGERIEYCTGDAGPVSARVRWIGDGSFGVEDVQQEGRARRPGSTFAPRSVRLPIGTSASIYIDGKRYCSELINISQFGACIFAPQPLSPGQLISIQIGQQTFSAATVRWAFEGKAGIKFATPMNAEQINALLGAISSDETYARSA